MTMSTGTPAALDLIEVIGTARTIRRYHFDPIPEDDLRKILWAATRAPSGTNRQPFRFVVLREGERAQRTKALLGEAFRRGWRAKAEQEGWSAADLAEDTRRGRTLAAMQFFVDHFERIPVVVLPCYVRYRELVHQEGASIFPACQNLFLAARALGYGACFSGWHLLVERELRELLEIPDGVELSLCITLGRPRGSHGPVRRRSMRELVFEERWGDPAPWAEEPPGSLFTRRAPAEPGGD